MPPKERAPMTVTNESAAEWVPIDALRPWDANPRKNDGEPVRKVAASIKRFGFGSPIIARRANGEIIAGHTRWKAAQKLGLDRVPVRFLDLDPADAHLLAIADNRVGEEAEWDEDLLKATLGMLQAEGADLRDTAFDEKELDKLLRDMDEGEDASEPAANIQYQVIVDCSDESDQMRILTTLESQGLKCRPILL
jgi:ParB-like chromosome segregation protein Spo0J